MTKWAINFVVDGRHLGEVMEGLQPYRVEDLGFKIVAGTPKKVRAGDKSAWEIVAGLADETARPTMYFRDKLRAAGFKDGSIYNALETARVNGSISKFTVKGVVHYKAKGKKS